MVRGARRAQRRVLAGATAGIASLSRSTELQYHLNGTQLRCGYCNPITVPCHLAGIRSYSARAA
ncbi:hypothetical protein PR003_g23657 [Phytophthora rubi]|uniref:Uncharacterized protein n=1 Tax=Phytophthora rubi TaxID=129364 RepID=A0A6A4D302_9STRA|nr:hypothetical protein PR003_g23657 [Phytophthora rubi]